MNCEICGAIINADGSCKKYTVYLKYLGDYPHFLKNVNNTSYYIEGFSASVKDNSVLYYIDGEGMLQTFLKLDYPINYQEFIKLTKKYELIKVFK